MGTHRKDVTNDVRYPLLLGRSPVESSEWCDQSLRGADESNREIWVMPDRVQRGGKDIASFWFSRLG